MTEASKHQIQGQKPPVHPPFLRPWNHGTLQRLLPIVPVAGVHHSIVPQGPAFDWPVPMSLRHQNPRTDQAQVWPHPVHTLSSRSSLHRPPIDAASRHYRLNTVLEDVCKGEGPRFYSCGE